MYLGATLLDMQALRKAAENLKVMSFPLVLTTLFKSAIYLLFSVSKAKIPKNLVGGTEFKYSFEKSCFYQKLFVTFLSVAVSRQKGRARAVKAIAQKIV